MVVEVVVVVVEVVVVVVVVVAAASAASAAASSASLFDKADLEAEGVTNTTTATTRSYPPCITFRDAERHSAQFAQTGDVRFA